MKKVVCKIHLIVIDPQIDFCYPDGALYVPGAEEDMNRVSEMIKRLDNKLDDIHVTLDSHHLVDIAHPIFWIDSDGNNPNPFTIISVNDVKSGNWSTTNPAFLKRATEYVVKLEENARYPLCIWPAHCLIGDKGYAIHEKLFATLKDWEKKNFAMINFLTKGSNFWTEHYSAVQADVPDSSDFSTQLNTQFINTLEDADVILIAGEAKSHCLANTIRDVANNFGEENIGKFILLEDCSSNVPGFEKLGEDFVSEMTKRGMRLEKSTEYLK
ncbi:hypothetical protein LCGC14_1070660 [marine sediment metagenome]|uniref:Isochorismatase-like domain-containing protein n=1 Tax=marine sediment metagenome TaxID=412755 RepID=A0A0F9QP68_9ZZZZ